MGESRILRKRREKNFKTIYLKPIQDNEELSWKAKGIHTYLISRPPGWGFHISDIVNKSKEGKTAVRSGLDELKDAGLLKIEKERDDEGKFNKVIWVVAETPEMLKGDWESHPDTCSPNMDEPEKGQPTPSNKYSSNKYKDSSNVVEQKLNALTQDINLNHSDPEEWSPKDLIDIYRKALSADADYEWTPSNWEDNIGIMSGIRGKFNGSSPVTAAFLEWFARKKFNRAREKINIGGHLGYLYSYINEFRNYYKDMLKDKQGQIKSEREAGYEPDEVPEGIEDADPDDMDLEDIHDMIGGE